MAKIIPEMRIVDHFCLRREGKNGPLGENLIWVVDTTTGVSFRQVLLEDVERSYCVILDVPLASSVAPSLQRKLKLPAYFVAMTSGGWIRWKRGGLCAR